MLYSLLVFRSSLLRFSRDRRNDGLDVAQREREALHVIGIAVDVRDMIRHQHAVVADLLVGARRLQHVDAAVVDERLAEVQIAPVDVAEVDVEDLPFEAANHVVDLHVRILELFRYGALAEVQAVVRALLDLHEAPQTGWRRERNLFDAAITTWHTGILRMAAHLHFVLFGNRHDPFEEVRDTPPVLVRADLTGERWLV